MKKVARGLLLLGFVLSQGCTYVPGVEPTDIEPIRQKVATRAEVEEILGEPEETLQTNVGVINIYSYDAGADGGFVGIGDQLADPAGPAGVDGALVWLAFAAVISPLMWVGTPAVYAEKVDNQTRYIAVIYSTDDKISYYNLGSGIEPLKESVVTERDLEARAKNGDAEAQWKMASDTTGIEEEKWVCLAAHGGHAEAQHLLGENYHYGLGNLEADTARAYVWLRLSKMKGYEEPEKTSLYRRTAGGGYACCTDENETAFSELELVVGAMTPDQITEAERLVAEWEPNPAECQAEAAKSEN